jgi:septal ring factor EnvC (AmiA/AmiB activator)
MPESLEARAERQRLQLLEMRAAVESLKKQLENSKASHVDTHNTVSELELKCSKLEARVTKAKRQRDELRDAIRSTDGMSKRRACSADSQDADIAACLRVLAADSGCWRRLCHAIHPDRIRNSTVLARNGENLMKALGQLR